jgi:hypothetical protein
MKLLGMLLISLSSLYTVLIAQQTDSLKTDPNPSTNAFQVNVINEAAVYYYLNSSSLRLGFSLSWNYSNTDPSTGKYHYTDAINTSNTTSQSSSSSSNSNYYSAIISALHMFPLNTSNQLQFKLGIGPTLIFNHSRSNSGSTYLNDSIRSESSDTYTNNSHGIGVLICCQVLVPLNSSLQLTAEYNLLGNYLWQNNESNYNYSSTLNNKLSSLYISQQNNDSQAWQFSLNRITFGIKYTF